MARAFPSFEFMIGSRYLRSRKRNRFISFISLISVLGIALAVAVLITVLSVMNGFEYEVRSRILSVVSHGAITGWDGRLEDWELARDLAASYPETRAVAQFISGQGMLVGAESIRGVELRGVEAFMNLDSRGCQQVAHGRIHCIVAAAHGVTQLFGKLREAAHQRAADAEKVDAGPGLVVVRHGLITT